MMEKETVIVRGNGHKIIKARWGSSDFENLLREQDELE